MHIYWTTVYDHGTKTDHILELEQLDESRWRVVLDDNESIMNTTLPSSDFWGLVSEALANLRRHQNH